MRKIRVVVKISRYQFEKKLGEDWRREGEGETFTEYRNRILNELKGKKKKNK